MQAAALGEVDVQSVLSDNKHGLRRMVARLFPVQLLGNKNCSINWRLAIQVINLYRVLFRKR